MKYQLQGNRASGESVSVMVIARDRSHAQEQATTLGITVTAIEPVPEPISPPTASQSNRRRSPFVGLLVALIARFL